MTLIHFESGSCVGFQVVIQNFRYASRVRLKYHTSCDTYQFGEGLGYTAWIINDDNKLLPDVPAAFRILLCSQQQTEAPG